MSLGAPPPAAPVDGDPVADAMSRLGGASGMVQTRTDYQTAVHVQVPRIIKRVEKEILEEAAEMGEDFLYTWEVNDKTSKTGKSRIEGISIDGAMIMMRNWGNCHCPTDLVDETPSHYLIKSTFIDLEKGFSVVRLFRQRKSMSMGGMDRDRAEDIAFQIGQSKCQRNAIEKGLPSWIQSRALEAAKLAAEKRYENVPAAVADARKYAAKLGITDDELERKVEARFADWVPRDLVYLKSVFRAIHDKQTTISLEFRADPPPETVAEVETAKVEPPDTLGFPPVAEPKPEPATTEPAGATAQPPTEPGPTDAPVAVTTPAATPAATDTPAKEPEPTFVPPTKKGKG